MIPSGGAYDPANSGFWQTQAAQYQYPNSGTFGMYSPDFDWENFNLANPRSSPIPGGDPNSGLTYYQPFSPYVPEKITPSTQNLNYVGSSTQTINGQTVRTQLAPEERLYGVDPLTGIKQAFNQSTPSQGESQQFYDPMGNAIGGPTSLQQAYPLAGAVLGGNYLPGTWANGAFQQNLQESQQGQKKYSPALAALYQTRQNQ